MPLRTLASLAVCAALLAACSDSDDAEQADTAAAPEVELAVAPAPTAAPDGTALVAGSWNVGEDAAGASAVFGEAGSEPRLSITCDAATRQATFTLARDASVTEDWRIDAGGEAAALTLNPTGSALPEISGSIDPGLAIFHAFSNAGEIVVLTSPQGERMQFPTHPGISRVLYACN